MTKKIFEFDDKYPFTIPGHFYSPIPKITEIRKRHLKIFDTNTKLLPGISINTENQLKLIETLSKFYNDLPFKETKQPNLHYCYKNGSYSYGDGIFLYSMLRHLQPKKMIEVGCGQSSALTLDVNKIFFNNSIDCHFIEPYPDLLQKLGIKDVIKPTNLHVKQLQDIPIELFKQLQSNDILFIDSSHVSKVGSDLNYLFFHILPSLNKGVYIHFHDIFWPFEYPAEWVYIGKAFNECYMLRTFLQFNDSFEITLFTRYLETHHKNILLQKFPLIKNNFGAQIWIKKVK